MTGRHGTEWQHLMVDTDEEINAFNNPTPRKKRTVRQQLEISNFLFRNSAKHHECCNSSNSNGDVGDKTKLKRLFRFVASLTLLHFIGSSFFIFQRKSNGRYYIHYQGWEEKCTLKKNGPLPVVLMALGRSGSSVTWNTLSRLTGDKTIAYEATGGNQNKSIDFFNGIPDHLNERWASLRLCNIQRRHMSMSKKDGKKYSIVGFQWKPYFATFDHPNAVSGLKRLADDRFQVIYLTRNPLDRFISNQKHKGFVRTNELPAHCSVNDVDCINRHKAHEKGIMIDVSDQEKKSNFISHMRQSIEKEKVIEERLDMFGVKHITVQYEKLFDSDLRDDESANEWIRLLGFLGFKPEEPLTMGEVRNTFEYASTSDKSHDKIIANYDQVKAALEGTELIELLH